MKIAFATDMTYFNATLVAISSVLQNKRALDEGADPLIEGVA